MHKDALKIRSAIATHLGCKPHIVPAFLSTDQVADILRVSRLTLANWRSKGYPNLPFAKVGRRVVYPTSAIIEFLSQRMRGEWIKED